VSPMSPGYTCVLTTVVLCLDGTTEDLRSMRLSQPTQWRLWCWASVLCLAGCASQTSFGTVLPGVDLRSLGALYVVRHAADGRGIDQMIARSLQGSGFEASSGPEAERPAAAEAIVTYEDRWQWHQSSEPFRYSGEVDMISLKVDIRDAQTHVLRASGHAYGYTMGTIERKSPEQIVGEVIAALLREGGA
jgi:hypothetical protein